MKESSVLTPSIIKTEKRKRLYHDRFLYALTFRASNLYMIRELPGRKKLDYWIGRRLETQRHFITTHGSSPYHHLSEESVAALRTIHDYLLALKVPFKFSVSFDQGNVYLSEYSELVNLSEFLANIDCAALKIREAVIVGNPDVITLKKSDYTSRVYLKDRRVEPDFRERLSAWLENNAQEVAPSMGLKSWLTHTSWRSGYLQRYFYIDCKDAAHHTLFAMTFPGIFRKAVPIVTK